MPVLPIQLNIYSYTLDFAANKKPRLIKLYMLRDDAPQTLITTTEATARCKT